MENNVIDSKDITPKEFIDKYRDFLKEDGELSFEKLFSKMLTDLFYPLTSGPSKEEMPAMWDATLGVFRDYDNIRKGYDAIKDKKEFKSEFAFDHRKLETCLAVLRRANIDIEERRAVIIPMSKTGDYFRGIVIMAKHPKKQCMDGEEWKNSLKQAAENFQDKIVEGAEVFYSYSTSLELEGHKFHIKDFHNIEAVQSKGA